jgi:hypothetical protein
MLILQSFAIISFILHIPFQNPFLPNVKVNNTSNFTHYPCVAVAPSGIVYVAYNVDIGWVPPDSTHIFLNASFDSGGTFGPDRMIFQGNKYNEICDLDIDKEEKVHVIYVQFPNLYAEDHLFYACSFDSGQSFLSSVQVDDNSVPIPIGLAKFSINDSGHIYVIWNDGRNYYSHIFFSKSTDGGQTFSANALIDTGDVTRESYHPNITLDSNGTIYLTWMRRDSGREDVYFCKSTDQGSTFTERVRVDTFSINTFLPDIATTGSDSIYICYNALSMTINSIYLSRSIDGGNTFTQTARINDSLFSSCYLPSICTTNDGKIHAIWQMLYDPLKKQEINYDIYYDYSDDCGISFHEDIMVNDDLSDSTREYASMDKDLDGNIYAAWKDWRSGYDIYFSRTNFAGVGQKRSDSNPIKIIKLFPTPFGESVTIELGKNKNIKDHGKENLKIYDICGRIVKEFQIISCSEKIKIVWDGRDRYGKEVNPGIYFLKLREIDIGKIIKL